MSLNLLGKSFLSLRDFSTAEIQYLLDLSQDLKAEQKTHAHNDSLKGKNIILIFNKPSTRTRCAFEVAAKQCGANTTYLANSHMGHKESLEDTAKVLGRFYDGIAFRGFEHSHVEQLAKYAGIPVWNGLTDQFHPTQILADFLTIKEKVSKPFNKIKLVFVGDARNNMGNSLMIGCDKLGMEFVALSPDALAPDFSMVNSGRHESDIAKAVADADVIYTDVWVSMGEENKYAERIQLLSPYQVNQQMLDLSNNPDVIFMHCLPAFHDLNTDVAKDIQDKFGLNEMEVTDEVFRSKHSVVFDQAENRLHTIKAVMVASIGH